MRFTSLTAATLFGATLLGAVAPAAAQARDWRDGPRYEQRHDNRGHDRRGYDRRGYDDRRYDDRNDRGYYTSSYRQPQRCKSSSTTGLLLGGVVGALLGRAVDTHGERTTGTVLGAGAGALLGNQVGKGC